MPKVSIIIPVYNVEKYLRQSLDSCINQTLKDIEIICVNDSSPDNSLEIIQEYAQKDNRIKIIQQSENHGAGCARNVGIDVAQGDYIMFLDPDDWLELDACEIAYNQIFKNNNDYVMFGYSQYYEESRQLDSHNKYLEPFYNELSNSNIKLWELQKPFIKSCYCVLQIYKKDFLNKNGVRYNSSLRIGEDVDFYFLAVANAETVSIINKSLYNYRIHSESIMNDRIELWEELLISRKNGYNIILKSPHPQDFMKSYVPYYTKSLLYWYKKWFNHSFSKDGKKYFTEMKKVFEYLLNMHSELLSKKDKRNREFYTVIKHSYYSYILLLFYKFLLSQIFSVKNEYSNNKKIKKITMLGIKFYLKSCLAEQDGYNE